MSPARGDYCPGRGYMMLSQRESDPVALLLSS